MTADEVVQEIIRVMNLPSGEHTDGECLDMITSVLEQGGYCVYDSIRSDAEGSRPDAE